MVDEAPVVVTSSLAPIAPFLRWAGSKRKLLPKLLPYWGTGHSRYLEPFAGSGALFFAISPASAVLSDINAELIEALQQVRDNAREVHRQLVSLQHSKDEYYRVRALDSSKLCSLDRSVRFIYLNRYCFNGLYRTNLAGHFNVPFAGSGTGEVPPLDLFLASAERLKGAVLVHGDFNTVVRKEVRSGDFVYLDPPYAVANRRIFRQYGPQTFGLEDLDTLRALMRAINDVGASFLLSYADCKESRLLGSDWNHTRVLTQRNIAGFHRHRRRAAETLISNIDLPEGRRVRRSYSS